jgi:L,D-peptidoglycan transpeptidase YkuD (ErfK/YbiS/YcfS/YnhG family)
VRAPRLAATAVALGAFALFLSGDSVSLPRWVPVTGGQLPPTALAIADEPEPAAPSPSPSSSPGPSPSPSVTPGPSPSPTPKRTQAPAARPSTKPAPPPPPSNLASRLHTLPAATRQVIVVYADSYGTSFATAETFQKVGGFWQPALGKMAARIGSRGFTDHKVEGDLTTPTGMYRIGGTIYGTAGNPGVRYAYHQLGTDDWWNENTASPGYNSFVHGPDPGGGSEALWKVTPQYTYFAVIDYNIPVVPADPARGSGIFLHVSANRGTAGCIALAQADLVRVLKWLDPGAAPRIVLAPSTALSRY